MKVLTHPAQNKGFALIVTLSLMILLTVIAVGLLSLSSVSLRATGQGDAMATAKANARLALMLALGDLQKTLGPDRAITATSEILGTATAGPAKPNLTGVWKSWDNFDPASSSLPDYLAQKKDKTEDANGRFSRWLVSSTDPAGPTTRNFATASWTGNTVELVGNGSLGTAAAASAKVTAGLVPVSKGGRIQGSYAWHVADESVKARINSYRDPGQNATLAQKRALLAGHRPDPSVITGADNTSLSFLPTDTDADKFAVAREKSGKLLDLNQVELLDLARGRTKQFRNDVTPYSLGVMTDVRNGGLKQDLSSIFEMSTASSVSLPLAFTGTAANPKKLYQSILGSSSAPSDPAWISLAGYYNTFRNIINSETAPQFSQAPREDIPVASNIPAGYYPGPVIAKVETLFTYVTRDAHGNWITDLKSTDPNLKYMGHIMFTPLVTLHNPYNVSISFNQLEVVFRNLPVAFQVFVNSKKQNSALVPICEMFVDVDKRGEKSFALNIGNWASPTAGAPASDIVMEPGRTLICGPYLATGTSFSNGGGVFFDYQNRLTGVQAGVGNTDSVPVITPVKATPGFKGRCIGYDLDWIAPKDILQDNVISTDGVWPVLGLRPSDTVMIKSAVLRPTRGPNTKFEIAVKITSKGVKKQYGGLQFYYKDSATLTNMAPPPITSATWSAEETHVPNGEPIINHGNSKTFAIFSAYARTANGGVYETGKRDQPAGSQNALLDGRLAGKPHLFHNPSSTSVMMNFSITQPGVQPYEFNYQPLPGNVDNILSIDPDARTQMLSGNTAARGVKAGSYIELPTGPMQTIADFRRSNALASTFLPSFSQPVANSLLHPLMSPDRVKESNPTISSSSLLDHSVLANHALYDRFYFSTFATNGPTTPDSVFNRFMEGEAPLLSQSFEPFLPQGKTIAAAKAELFSGDKPNSDAYKIASEYQMIRGPFNVNSTSVQAWKAILASTNKASVPILWARNQVLGVKTSVGAPILSMSLPNGGAIGSPANAGEIDDQKTNDWNGYRELNDAQLNTLATQIVNQVRLRGPFLNMSEFVNRQVGPLSPLSLTGALEKAIIDAGINDNFMGYDTMMPYVTKLQEGNFTDPLTSALYNYKTLAATVGNPAAGAPGWVSQGDLLRILEPAATVRSDTFVIRVCGQAQDSVGKVTARAYAEAVVQRTPEYVDPRDRPSLNAYDLTFPTAVASTATATNKLFGRRMNVVSFRWLSSSEI